jgi:RNA polymerase sigma-70 factor (ECF subfamily)
VLERSEPLIRPAPEAFEDFYGREYLAVVGLAYALSGSRWGAEDLAQEAFMAAHRDWARIGLYDKPGAWVRRVVANLSVSSLRRRAAEARALARFPFGHETALPDLADGDPEFWAGIRSLPRRQAQVVALYYLEDRSVAEIAEILDVTLGTVKRHLHNGRQALARRLRADEEDRT